MSDLITRPHYDSSTPAWFRSADLFLRGVWYVGWLVLLATVVWLLADGYLGQVDLASSILGSANYIGPDNAVGLKPGTADDQSRMFSGSIVQRVVLFRFAVWLLIATTLLKCISLFFLDSKFRGTQAMLGLIAYIATWLSVVVQSNSIVETGRAYRIRWQSDEIISFADNVNRDWENIVSGEGYSPIGYVNPYPFGEPTLLMMLGEQQIPKTSISFNAIERSGNKTVRFELTGSNVGYWLEVRRDEHRPVDFVGGLLERYTMVRSRDLSHGIHLVQYRAE